MYADAQKEKRCLGLEEEDGWRRVAFVRVESSFIGELCTLHRGPRSPKIYRRQYMPYAKCPQNFLLETEKEMPGEATSWPWDQRKAQHRNALSDELDALAERGG